MTRHRKNTRDKNTPRIVILALFAALTILAGAGIGVFFAYNTLKDMWLQQCRVEDREIDIVITSGKMVHPDVITLHFGLTNGANLAHIPYAELRNDLLKRVPNIKDIKIERRMPNRVTVDVFEREPIARVARGRRKGESGLVADAEGVVFRFSNNTAQLPVIREDSKAKTQPGEKLTGPAAAALRLIEAAAHPDLVDLRVLEVDAAPEGLDKNSKKNNDYLLITLGNFDRVKIAWDHMADDTRLARESLTKQLKRIAKAINLNITPRNTVWIATDWGSPGRVYAADSSRNGNQ